MIFASLALLSGMALVSKAAPQGWYPPPYSPPPVAHYVNISNDTAGLVYVPPYILAAPGDTVTFTFHIKNHSLTQSSFDDPCTPLLNGTDTGFHPVAPGTSDTELPTVQLTVIDSNPVWFHCQQDANTANSHCGKGMVFAINPTANKTFEAFQEKALAIGAALAASNGTSSNGTVSDWSATTSTTSDWSTSSSSSDWSTTTSTTSDWSTSSSSSYDWSTTTSTTSDWSTTTSTTSDWSTTTSTTSDWSTTTSTTSDWPATTSTTSDWSTSSSSSSDWYATTSTTPDWSASSSVTSYWSAPSSSASSWSASSSATY